MSNFYQLQEDIFAKYVPKLSSELGDGISFRTGRIISKKFPLPLVYSTGHTLQDPPKAMHNEVTPVMSESFIAALQQAGVSNLHCYPAELRSRTDGAIWKNYKAVNIIGLVSCANIEKSEFTHIIDRPEEDSMPLMAFEDLRIDPSRASGFLLFRLAESPGVIIVAERVVEYLRKCQSDDEWGITIDER
jgi:hypothetical protein